MITTVLLDAGGVIVDESRIEITRGEIITRILSRADSGYSLERYFEDVRTAVINFELDIYRAVIRMNTPRDSALADSLNDEQLADFRSIPLELKLADGFEREAPLIGQRHKMLIAGQYGREMLGLLESHSLLEHFANRLTQDDFTITKPNPDYLRQVAQRVLSEPGECVMVGDRIDKDIVPAKQIGMRTIRIRTGIHKDQEPRDSSEVPDLELPSIRGLADAVNLLASRT